MRARSHTIVERNESRPVETTIVAVVLIGLAANNVSTAM
jgi:hypothetical protein